MTFETRVISALHDLAVEILQDVPAEGTPLYGKLKLVAHYLDTFSQGQWARLGDDERSLFLRDMHSDFNLRAWDSWLRPGGGAYDQVTDLIVSQQKLVNRKA